jgi:hypothetical protein
MRPPSLTHDEFRLLAYLRGYADRCEQHLDPTWVQKQLVFSIAQMLAAARGLAAQGLAEFFEYDPPEDLRLEPPEFLPGPVPCDIRLTEYGWNYLRRDLTP